MISLVSHECHQMSNVYLSLCFANSRRFQNRACHYQCLCGSAYARQAIDAAYRRAAAALLGLFMGSPQEVGSLSAWTATQKHHSNIRTSVGMRLRFAEQDWRDLRILFSRSAVGPKRLKREALLDPQKA